MSAGRAQDLDVRAASADRCGNSDHGVTRTTPVRYLLPGARIRSTHARTGAYATRAEHFATRAAARTGVAAWIEDYNT
jgi:hypothetical protein